MPPLLCASLCPIMPPKTRKTGDSAAGGTNAKINFSDLHRGQNVDLCKCQNALKDQVLDFITEIVKKLIAPHIFHNPVVTPCRISSCAAPGTALTQKVGLSTSSDGVSPASITSSTPIASPNLQVSSGSADQPQMSANPLPAGTHAPVPSSTTLSGAALNQAPSIPLPSSALGAVVCLSPGMASTSSVPPVTLSLLTNFVIISSKNIKLKGDISPTPRLLQLSLVKPS